MTGTQYLAFFYSLQTCIRINFAAIMPRTDACIVTLNRDRDLKYREISHSFN